MIQTDGLAFAVAEARKEIEFESVAVDHLFHYGFVSVQEIVTLSKTRS